MTIAKALLSCSLLALLTLRSAAQDITVRNLQGWLDFLEKDASLTSVTNRIGQADAEKSVDYMASSAQMYAWNNRFENDAAKNYRLELVAVPDNDPVGSHMIVIAILDPDHHRGIYLPWARRFVDDVPNSNFIPRTLMAALWE